MVVAAGVVGGALAYAWISSSSPRQMWFQQETVTKTVTVAPWWTDAITVVLFALLLFAIRVMLVIGPRRV